MPLAGYSGSLFLDGLSATRIGHIGRVPTGRRLATKMGGRLILAQSGATFTS